MSPLEVCHTATNTSNIDVRWGTTWSCDLRPLGASTPTCSQRSLADRCCDRSTNDDSYPPSPILISQHSSELSEEIILQCSGSSDSICSDPDVTCSPDLTQQLSNTHTGTGNNTCENTVINSPSTDFAKEWFCNKTFEFKHKIQDMICHPIKISEKKHVDFCDSGSVNSSNSSDSTPCYSKSCKNPDVHSTPCQVTSFKYSYIDIAGKLCDLCKQVLDQAPPRVSCRHVDITDQLCKQCKDILDSAPHQTSNSCKYCAVADKFCKHCKYILVSKSSESPCLPAKLISYVDIAEKLCELCREILNPAPCQPVHLCDRFDIVDKLCKKCKHVIEFAPCNHSTPCKHCDITFKLCKTCKHIVDSSPYPQDKVCKLSGIADKVCGMCKLVLEPLPCQPDPCKHCDITKKLCKKCKDILDHTSCQLDKSCKNLALADKLCVHCRQIFDSAPCPLVKSCKLVDIADRLCELCKQLVNPTSCQSVTVCDNCDIYDKLCKQCQRIFDCQTDRSCKNIDIANRLCEKCRIIYASAPCQKVKSSVKQIDFCQKPNNHCKLKLEHDACQPDNLCRHCDITKKLCKECRQIYDYASCQTDRSCKNVDFIDRLCDHCKHVFDDVSCQPIKSCMKNVNIVNESREKCKIDPVSCKLKSICKNCDVTKNLCKECKKNYESAPCQIEKSCKNIDSLKLCEHCRHVLNSSSCQPFKSYKKNVTVVESREECETNHASCGYIDSNPKCDVTKKLCKSCKHIFDLVPCADRSCKNIAFMKKLCEQCRHVIKSSACQPLQSCTKFVKLCKECYQEPIPCTSTDTSGKCDITKKLCEECKIMYDSIPCADRSCKNIAFINKLCEHCRHAIKSPACQPIEPCTKHVTMGQSCKECYQKPIPCTSIDTSGKCDITKKLCEKCKIMYDSIPCADRSCKNIAFINKLCEHCRHSIKSPACQPIEPCTKHVTMGQSCKECYQEPIRCTSTDNSGKCDITKKLCKECKRIYDSIPCADRSCKNIAFINKLCEHCRHSINSPACQPIDPCTKHVSMGQSCKECYQEPIPCTSTDTSGKCDITKKLCEKCKIMYDSIPCADRSCKNIAFINKLCEHCRHSIKSPACQPIEPCTKHVTMGQSCKECYQEPIRCTSTDNSGKCDITKKLCKECKRIYDSIPCADRSCKNIAFINKLCEHCRHSINSPACQPIDPCTKHVSMGQSCKECYQEPIRCTSTDNSGKCDITKKLCKECKRIYDSIPCADRSCKNIAFINKLCEHCRHSINSPACQPIDPCTKHVSMGQSCKECYQEPIPCTSTDTSGKCDITKKLCKECKRIYDSIPCADRSCKNIAFLNMLCEHCRHAIQSSACQPFEPGTKHITLRKSCKECYPEPIPCTSADNGGICDITKKICKECKQIYNSIPCADRSCKNIAFINKLCEHCRHVIQSSVCQSHEPPKRVALNKSCKQCYQEHISCKSEDIAEKCDITKKLCTECKQIYDSIPCEDRSCKNIAFITRFCEHCRHVIESYACQSPQPCTKHVTVDESCKDCYLDPNPCTSVDTSRKCDITKKLCKECKQIYDSVLCEDRSCKNIAFIKRLCEHCRSVIESSTDQSFKSSMHHDHFDKSCEKSKFISGSHSSNTSPCKRCNITKKLCEECKIIFESVPCADRSCQNLEIANILCENCRHIYLSGCSQATKACETLHVSDRPCERCRDVPDFILCQPVKSCKDVLIQVPDKGEFCKKVEELFFNDQATECSSVENWKCGKCACALESQSAATLITLGSLIKQEAKSTCFDIAKESICRSSGSSPESPGSSCASARARYYQNKLLATLQILQNKEETVRVQTDSLAVAEARLASLNARHAELRRELHRKETEIQSLRDSLKECRTCKANTCDVSITVDIPEMDDQKKIVTTLQNNLEVIEDLYQECFYESVRQENLIEKLRSSYLDMRLMEREKSAKITSLNHVIRSQKWSLDRCQDIGTEVDNLKMEISNFINSSNNDSGVWEQCAVSGLHEDLQDIAAQLMKLQDLLAGDCTCGLKQENERLRQENESLEGDISELRIQVSSIKTSLAQKDLLERQCREQIETKERELSCVLEQLQSSMQNSQEKTKVCDSLTLQLTDTKASLEEKIRELSCLQRQCGAYETSLALLKEDLHKSEQGVKESAALRSEVRCVSARAARAQHRAAELEGELARAREHCARVDAAYRDRTSTVSELEHELDAAHARGAELCAEAGRVVRAARCWAARMRDVHREQEKSIKEKECKLRWLQGELQRRQVTVCPRLWEGRELSGCASAPSAAGHATVTFGGASATEVTEAGCSMASIPPPPACSTPAPDEPHCSSTPLPALRRTCKKKPTICGFKRRYGWLGPFAATSRDAGAQHPARHDAASCARCRRPPLEDAARGPISPGEEMFSRMESLSTALADSYKRWSRRAPT